VTPKTEIRFLDYFNIVWDGKDALDIGASTG